MDYIWKIYTHGFSDYIQTDFHICYMYINITKNKNVFHPSSSVHPEIETTLTDELHNG